MIESSADFNQTVWRRARRNTLDQVHSLRFWVAEIGVAVAAGLVASLWVSAGWSPIFQYGLPALSAALAPFLLLNVLFVRSLIFAPFEQRDEARSAVRRLTDPRDDVQKAIDHLKARSESLVEQWSGQDGTTESHERREDDAFMLEVDFSETLAGEGLTLPSNDWFSAGQRYKGLDRRGLLRFLSVLRIIGIVNVHREARVSEDLRHYTLEKYYLTDFGAAVVSRMEEITEREFPEELE